MQSRKLQPQQGIGRDIHKRTHTNTHIQGTSLNATGFLPPGTGLLRPFWKELRLLVLWAAGVKAPHQSAHTLLLLHFFRAVKEGADEPEGARGWVGVWDCFFRLVEAPWLTHRFILISPSNAQLWMFDKLWSHLSDVLRQFERRLKDWPHTSL